MRLERLGQLKYSMALSGIETEIFLLVTMLLVSSLVCAFVVVKP
jgi:hypothetical protein